MLSDTVPEATPDPAAPPAEKKDDKGSALWREIKGLLWVLLAVLAFHSLVAKPFYIPSESMMPGLLTGDRLVVTKYPYGWSWVSPSFHIIGPMKGRLFGRMPERGDIVIVTPPGTRTDYIKRVIGLPGDTRADGRRQLIINGQAVKRQPLPPDMVPIDTNSPCGSEHDPGALRLPRARCRRQDVLPGAGRPRDAAQRPLLRDGRARPLDRGQFRSGQGPRRPPLADGRQPRRFGRQPGARMAGRPRRAGAVGEYRRPRRIHHFLARRNDRNGGTRSAGSRRFARAAPERRSGTADGHAGRRPPSRMSSGPVRRSSATRSSAARWRRRRSGSAWRLPSSA